MDDTGIEVPPLQFESKCSHVQTGSEIYILRRIASFTTLSRPVDMA